MAGVVIAASFVEPRGSIRSVIVGTIAREAAGMAGAVTASNTAPGKDAGTSPLAKGAIGYLVAFDDQLVLYRAKRGAFKPKATEEVVACAPRHAIASAAVERKKLAGVMEVAFGDGSTWTFDVPKIHLSTAEKVAVALAESGGLRRHRGRELLE